jgi:hypothetical protein
MIIGDRLGLHDTLTCTQPITANQAGLPHPRLVTERLGVQTMAGHLRHSPVDDTYELPGEQAIVLVLPDFGCRHGAAIPLMDRSRQRSTFVGFELP